MSTTTTPQIVHPAEGDVVFITYGERHEIGGRVVRVYADGFDVRKSSEYLDGSDASEPTVGEVFTLFDVEQQTDDNGDAVCVVRVQS